MSSLLRSALFGSSLVLAVLACSSSDDGPGSSVTNPPDGGTSGSPDLDSGSAPETGTPAPVITLGPPDFIDFGLMPADFEIDVPAGALGFSLQPNAEVLGVTDPTGVAYLPADRPATLPVEIRALTRFPSSSKLLAVPSGKWKVKLAAPANVRATWQRTADGKFHGGTLDLIVHVPTGLHVNDFITGEAPADVVTPANAAANPVVKSVLDNFFTNLKRLVGLDRGNVSFVEADAKFVRIETDEERTQANNVTGQLEKNTQFGLHILFTEYSKTDTQLGFGSYNSGIGFDRSFGTVVVKMKDQRPAGEDPQPYKDLGFGAGDLSASTMLHEAFHAWGLPHTSEPVDAYDDGFTDTPVCTKTALAGDKKLCPDATNIMAPFLLTPLGKATVSPHQLAVIQGTSVYHPNAQ